MTSRTSVVAVTALILMTSGAAAAQQPPASAPASAAEDVAKAQAARIATLNDKTPLQVQVVVSRYAGDKKIASMPYVLSVNAAPSSSLLNQADNSRLRMGAKVPVPATAFGVSKPGEPAPLVSFSYENIGTNIDTRARSMGDGRFELLVSVEENSLYTDPQDTNAQTGGRLPAMRSFQASHTLILRDGQSRQFTAATDRVNGEVVRIDVTLNVLK